MKLRKINAVFSLITTTLLFAHAISTAMWMLSRGRIPHTPRIMSWIMAEFFAIHAIICIAQMISSHMGVPENKGKQYPKLNAPTIVQRATGMLMTIFTWLHIAGTIGIMTPPQVVHAIVPPLFFTLVMAHVAVSTSKAFITLGIGNATFVKRADKVIKAVCVVTLIADIVGFYLFIC